MGGMQKRAKTWPTGIPEVESPHKGQGIFLKNITEESFHEQINMD